LSVSQPVEVSESIAPKRGGQRAGALLAKSLFVALALFISLICASFFHNYTPYSDDFAWILHCDHRFANAAEWFTRGSTDYHINYPGLVNRFNTANFRPLTASFFYFASLFHTWMGYKSQLALNYVLLMVVICMYLSFLRRFTPLPTTARWMVAAAFLVSPVWSDTYFYPSVRIHLLECACTLLASLLLVSVAGGSLFRRVVPSAIVSAGAVFAHELGAGAPLIVAWTHYNVLSGAGHSRRRAAWEAFLIVAVAFGVYFGVRLAFFQIPLLHGYHAYQTEHPKSLVVAVVGVAMRLFFPFETYVSGGALSGGRGTPIGWLMVLFTLAIYLLLAVGLVRKTRYRSDLRMLTGCVAIAAAPLVFAVIVRQFSIVLIYCLPLAYLAVESLTSARVKRLGLRWVGAALIAGAGTIYIGAGIQSFLKARLYWQVQSGYSRSTQEALASAMKRGARHVFLVNDVSAYYGSMAMLQLTAKENGVTLADPTVVNELSLENYQDATPAPDDGILADCRGDVFSIQIDLAPGGAFVFSAEPHLLLTRANASGGRYAFPYLHETEFRGRLTGSSIENIDFGRRLVFTAPTVCNTVAVVGFPGRGRPEPKIFLLGSQQNSQAKRE
jgi:hypothetical protein